ncbi:MAG TPA: C40 family peptidase [Gemmatimonadales bacterium]|nr:C40 family peptidase [Gemmatimonadales bacterium]
MKASAFVVTLLLMPGLLRAQDMGVRVGRLFDGDGLTSYQFTTQAAAGALAGHFGGLVFTGPGTNERRIGLGLDATLFRGGDPGFYAVGGIGGGLGFSGADGQWHSWSAGMGFELPPAGPLSLGLEGRWRSLMPAHRDGPELSIRLGADFGRRRPAPLHPPASPWAATDASTSGAPAVGAPVVEPAVRGESVDRSNADALVLDIVRIAEQEIGRPYTYGGEGADGEGFDCSGLIQYAYGEAGISLPRTSVQQARQGREIGRTDDNLRPGDILTFAERGTRVTHVGLYMGDGRFIHSASRGVQISTLGESDPNGRWWYQRWVGVRRIIESQESRVES